MRNFQMKLLTHYRLNLREKIKSISKDNENIEEIRLRVI